MAKKQPTTKDVVTLTHDEASRRNIPTAELESVMKQEQQSPLQVAYERRNRDLDPQLVWRGKDEQDQSDLVVPAPPLFIQEKVHPKVLIDDLRRQTDAARLAKQVVGYAAGGIGDQIDLFADFNGLPTDPAAKTDFYAHDGHWTNRLILGDSLQVMASLAEREGLRGKVQCIYLDPPYGIKFNSNFQWSTTSRDVRDGNVDHMTREPEQVKAFRDTWRDGIHSYLSYLRGRIAAAIDLLHESGSIFVQIGDENVHRVRSMMEEALGEDNYISSISFVTTHAKPSNYLSSLNDTVIWFAKNRERCKYRSLYLEKGLREGGGWAHNSAELPDGSRIRPGIDRIKEMVSEGQSLRPYTLTTLSAQGASSQPDRDYLVFDGKKYHPGSKYHWKTTLVGMGRVGYAGRIEASENTIRYVRFHDDFSIQPLGNIWNDTTQAGYADTKLYVVQTLAKVIQRCVLMTTDPGDLVLDPTCGSGTTAYVAEQWGRRWIAIDTSRVALALARARIMGARYPYYLKADSREGQLKEAAVTRTPVSSAPTRGDLRHGFVYERVPHVTLKSIANNAEIDVIWDNYRQSMEPLRETINQSLRTSWQEWEIPREAEPTWPALAKTRHKQWWDDRLARQREIDASIAAKAEFEYLYDKPYDDPKKVRVAGPFTVESLSPHRTLGVGPDDELIDPMQASAGEGQPDFAGMVLAHLRTAGVQQADKADRITFTSVEGGSDASLWRSGGP